MVDFTLRQMANGGVYDHVGGGFHRYATDRAWRVPHFEKMLNDNALLLSACLEAYQLSDSPFFRSIAEEIVSFVFRDLLREPAGFASSIDADVHGKEGAYFTWDEPELVELLGTDRAYRLMKFYNMTRGGNAGYGNNVMYTVGVTDRSQFEEERKILLEARNKREKPYTDMSIHASWTALMITSFVRAHNVLGNRQCLDYARKSADFIMSDMYHDGTLIASIQTGLPSTAISKTTPAPSRRCLSCSMPRRSSITSATQNIWPTPATRSSSIATTAATSSYRRKTATPWPRTSRSPTSPCPAPTRRWP